jgi:hypothetical protein
VLPILPLALAAGAPPAAPPVAASPVIVKNRSNTPLTLSAGQIAKLPRATVRAGSQRLCYQGAPVAELLRAAGIPWGGNCSRFLTCYVVIEGADGYRVIFSIPEIAPELRHTTVLLADRVDGKPLSSREGPYEIIEEDARQRGRWVRQVVKISIQELGPPACAEKRPDASAKNP